MYNTWKKLDVRRDIRQEVGRISQRRKRVGKGKNAATKAESVGSEELYVTSSTEVSKTRKCVWSLDSSDQPTTSRQFIWFASFSPAPEKSPSSSSVTPRNMRNKRVNTQFSTVTEMSIAAAILLGDIKRYAILRCAEKAAKLLLWSNAVRGGAWGAKEEKYD